MGLTSTFGKRLKHLRESAGLTQSELADKLGVSRGSISYYENGERTADIEFLDKALEYFGVSIDFLMGWSNNKKSEYVEAGYTFDLSDKAQDALVRSGRGAFLSELLEDSEFMESLNALYEYVKCEEGYTRPEIMNLMGVDAGEYYLFRFTKMFIEAISNVKDTHQVKKYENMTAEEKDAFINNLKAQSQKTDERIKQIRDEAEKAAERSLLKMQESEDYRIRADAQSGEYSDDQPRDRKKMVSDDGEHS